MVRGFRKKSNQDVFLHRQCQGCRVPLSFSASHQCLEGVLVVPPLAGGQVPVRGHADEGDLRRRADEGAAAAGRHPDAGLDEEAGRRAVLARQVLEEPSVDACKCKRCESAGLEWKLKLALKQKTLNDPRST